MSKLKKALEKAKEARMADNPWDTTIEPGGLPECPMEGVKPSYSRTRVVELDPDRLRKHKIVSLFHEAALSDQLKILRTQVLNRMEEIGGNTLLVTSANPLEGKTTTAVNLAVSISHKLNHTVLLVDANLKNPFIHSFFGCQVQWGLSDYLLGTAEVPDILVNPGIEKLVIFPGGKPLPNSTEILGSQRMESLVKEMKGRYPDRYILFDSSALLHSADPLVFSRFVDAVLLVVEAERTSSKELEKAFELLKDQTIIGTVLNKAIAP